MIFDFFLNVDFFTKKLHIPHHFRESLLQTGSCFKRLTLLTSVPNANDLIWVSPSVHMPKVSKSWPYIAQHDLQYMTYNTG